MGTYNDWDGGRSAQDLFDEAVSVIQRLHYLSLSLGDLKKRKTAKERKDKSLVKTLLERAALMLIDGHCSVACR